MGEDKENRTRTAKLNPTNYEPDEQEDEDFLEKDIREGGLDSLKPLIMHKMDAEINRAVKAIAGRKKVSTSEVWRHVLSRGYDCLKKLPEVQAYTGIETYGKITRKTPQHLREWFENGSIDIPYFSKSRDAYTNIEPKFKSEISNIATDLRGLNTQTIWRVVARCGLVDSKIATTEDRQSWVGELRKIREEIGAWVEEAKKRVKAISEDKRARVPYKKTSFAEVLQPLKG